MMLIRNPKQLYFDCINCEGATYEVKNFPQKNIYIEFCTLNQHLSYLSKYQMSGEVENLNTIIYGQMDSVKLLLCFVDNQINLLNETIKTA